jgi:hypothetical protein
MTNLKAILHPAYEPGDGRADGAQLVDGEWWHPIFGCDSLQKVVDNVRTMLQLPPNYIDPEHQGQDRELLEAFYQACNAEGGTADEIHLRGIKAALASAQPAALAQPAEDSTDDSELLSTYHAARNDHQYNGMGDGWQWRAERAATVCGLRAVLARYGRPTFQPIPVSERLPGPEDCTPWPDTTNISWCWAATDDDGEWGWSQCSIRPSDFGDSLSRIMRGRGCTHWAPWWALPLPGATEEVGEGQS